MRSKLTLSLLIVFSTALIVYDLWLVASGRFQPVLIIGVLVWLVVLYVFSVHGRGNHRSRR